MNTWPTVPQMLDYLWASGEPAPTTPDEYDKACARAANLIDAARLGHPKARGLAKKALDFSGGHGVVDRVLSPEEDAELLKRVDRQMRIIAARDPDPTGTDMSQNWALGAFAMLPKPPPPGPSAEMRSLFPKASAEADAAKGRPKPLFDMIIKEVVVEDETTVFLGGLLAPSNFSGEAAFVIEVHQTSKLPKQINIGIDGTVRPAGEQRYAVTTNTPISHPLDQLHKARLRSVAAESDPPA